jgi:hypothetical protein
VFFPKNTQRLTVSKALLSSILLAATLSLASAGDAYKWSVSYIIDNSETVAGRPQMVFPRRNRGLAISPDGRYLYAGYHHSFDGHGEVRRIATEVADFGRATVSVMPGPMGKAITTDDKGRVYIADLNEIIVCDAELEHRLFRIPIGVCEGIATARDGGTLLLFTSDRETGTIQRWVLTEKDNTISDAKLAGFDGTGTFKVPNAQDLRGLKVDSKGNIWVCDLTGGHVFRVRKDGKDVKSVDMRSPIDVAFDKGRAFVTRWTDRGITVIDEELVVIGNLNVPWQELALSPFGNNRFGALSGIVTVPGKGFFVTNEGGQTAGQLSIYGKADRFSGEIEGVNFKDMRNDDNDPILKATEVVTGQ